MLRLGKPQGWPKTQGLPGERTVRRPACPEVDPCLPSYNILQIEDLPTRQALAWGLTACVASYCMGRC